MTAPATGCHRNADPRGRGRLRRLPRRHQLRIDADTASFPYVTGWAASIDGAELEHVVRLTAERVRLRPRHSTPAPPRRCPRNLANAVQSGVAATAALRDRVTAMPTAASSENSISQPLMPPPQPPAQARTWTGCCPCTPPPPTFTPPSCTPDGRRAAPGATASAGAGHPAARLEQYGIGYAPPGWTALTEHFMLPGLHRPGAARRGGGLPNQPRRFDRPVPRPGHVPGPGAVRPGDRAFIGRTLAAVADRNPIPEQLGDPAVPQGRVPAGRCTRPHRSLPRARPVLVEGLWDAIAVNYAGAGRYVGVTGSGTALTREHVVRRARPPGAIRIAAFDADAGGRNAAPGRSRLREAGYWPRTATFPDGHDPASLLRDGGPVAPGRSAVRSGGAPAGRPRSRRAPRQVRRPAAVRRDPALRGPFRQAVIADLPAEHVGRQVARIAGALDLDTAEVTAYVAEAVTRIADARSAASRRATAQPSASPVPDQAEFPTPVTSAAITYSDNIAADRRAARTAAATASTRSHHAARA